MAKMRIHEISKSLKAQGKNIKSSDLIELLRANGFEAKSPNSNIEDAAIAFLLRTFAENNNGKSAAPDKKDSEGKTAVKEKAEKTVITEDKTKKTEAEKKTETETVTAAEKKTEPVQVQPDKTDKRDEPESKEKIAEPVRDEGMVKAMSGSDKKPETSGRSRDNGSNREFRGNRQPRDNRENKDNRDGRNFNRDNRGQRGGFNNNQRNSEHRSGDNRNSDNRGGNRPFNRDGANRGGRDGRKPNGEKVFERFEKSQSGFDSIKQEQKPGRTQRQGKDGGKRDNKKYARDRKDYDNDDTRLTRDSLNKKKDPNRKGAFIKPEVVKKEEPEDSIRTIMLPEKLTLKELGDKIKVPAAQIVKKLFMKGKMISINQEISFDEAEEIALEYNCIAEMEEKVDVIAELLKEDEEEENTLSKRPPVVCVMGHVDHGKTSLLDAIRKTDVISREAGGITQHIGAYMVKCNGEKITFLDTPGHEAFTSMRMRGAKSTDIAILVVAADDGVMPQTIEAINHAKAAGVEIIVAVNKIDKPGANIERVKQELVEYELVAEDWGGSTVFVPVSAKSGEGIDNLLEMILLTAEVLELKANSDRNARGIVIEAQLDRGRGPVATILVQKGTLHVGDHIVIGSAHGRVRAMMDDKGRRVKEAKPSTPVEIIGLNEVPDAGEVFITTDNEKEARTIVAAYIDQSKAKLIEDTKSVLSLDGLFDQIQAGNIKELNIIIKADVQGSVEAIKQSLLKLSNEEVAIRIIHGGVGAITESDVTLAIASSAIIIGFNVRPDNMAKSTADREKVDLRLYRVIYDAISDIENAMKGMLDPIYEEKVIGHADVRQTFKASGLGTIAGSYVLDGKIARGCKARITRNDELIFEGALASLKRFKDDVKEVAAGYECGLVFEGFNDINVEDKVELYIMVEVPR
ncbi:MAG: translation initiation factor IF-2 [Lachnospiraceae bacterium]|nr:translation initiation factor IF-2 [Lachnospiraceae bacterium]